MKISVPNEFWKRLNPVSKVCMFIGWGFINFAFWLQGFEGKDDK